MKYSMIKYQFKNGTTEDWHREVARFISASTAIRISRAGSATAA